MNIGIDADGVLTNMIEFVYQYGERFFGIKPVNPNGYSTTEVFSCSKKREFMFGLRYFFTYCKKWPPRENASEVINMLKVEGNKLYEITARKFAKGNNPLGWYSRKVFMRWLSEHNMSFDDIYYCSESRSPEDKLSGCKKYSIDIMIDDKPDVVEFLASNGIKVLMFDAPYNKYIEGENITRVKNWNDVYNCITQNYKTKLL